MKYLELTQEHEGEDSRSVMTDRVRRVNFDLTKDYSDEEADHWN
jgi:hypothetical protein